MAAGKRCATLRVASLVELWGEVVEVRKSQVEGKKYPLYLSTKTGPTHFNTPTGQEFLLNFADFDSGPLPEAANDPGPVLAVVQDPGPEPEIPATPGLSPEPAPEDDPEYERKKAGFLKWLGDFADG